MNCRKHFPKFALSPAVQKDIDRIKAIWQKCKSDYGAGGDWLFGDYSIADAMYAPVVLRFNGYDVPLGQMEESYVNHVLDDPHLMDWINAGKEEKENKRGR